MKKSIIFAMVCCASMTISTTGHKTKPSHKTNMPHVDPVAQAEGTGSPFVKIISQLNAKAQQRARAEQKNSMPNNFSPEVAAMIKQLQAEERAKAVVKSNDTSVKPGTVRTAKSNK